MRLKKPKQNLKEEEEKETNHYVYMVRDNKRFYIGVRSCDCLINLDEYMGSYTDKSFYPTSKQILSICNSREEALEVEVYWQELFDVINNPLAVNKSIYKGSLKFGLPIDKQAREKLSVKRKKILQDNPEQSIHIRYPHRTAEHNAKVSAALKGRTFSSESKKKMSDAKIDKTIYNWYNKKLNTQETLTHKEMYTKYNLNKSNLRSVINGERKTCGGWKLCA